MDHEPRLADGRRPLDEIVGFLCFSSLEQDVGEIRRALGLEARPFDEVTHPYVLLCAEKVALVVAHDASDEVRQGYVQDVALSLRSSDRDGQGSSRLLWLAGECECVE